MELKRLKIDEEFRHLIRPLRHREFLQLEQNIINDGCRDPIVVWHDTIVDGHNRYEICMRHSIPFDTKDMEFECREAAVAWICANQLGRRNITEETRKFLIGMQYENEKLVTRIRNKIGRNQHTLDISTMDEEDADKACRHWTAQRIAEDNNVSAATVQKYAIFTRALEEIGKKEPKLVPKILSGQYKIAHKHVLEMAELNPQDLRRINRKIDRNPAEFMHYKATRPVVQGNKTVYSEGDISTGPSVKDILGFGISSSLFSIMRFMRMAIFCRRSPSLIRSLFPHSAFWQVQLSLICRFEQTLRSIGLPQSAHLTLLRSRAMPSHSLCTVLRCRAAFMDTAPSYVSSSMIGSYSSSPMYFALSIILAILALSHVSVFSV